MPDSGGNVTSVDCLICAEHCEALAVFSCGHCVCYVCGLRIHSISRNSCPVCREAGKFIIITRTLPEDCASDKEAHQFDAKAIRAMQDAGVYSDRLKCYVVGSALAKEIVKLCEFLCPIPSCWSGGEQEPFYELGSLKQHLLVDHKLSYCKVCLEHRKVFLCEQCVYTSEEIKKHMVGKCPKDSSAFAGHPPCHFCSGRPFYDEEHLMKHMRHDHMTCDFCSRTEYRFTFYQSREKLLKHYESAHCLCDHPDCAAKDPMERVFAFELDLAAHRQRAHGVRARVPLSIGDAAPAPPDSAAAPAAAAGTNTSALHIIFDHVTRRVTLELMPSGAKSEEKARGNGKRGAAAHTVQASGLPAHFRSAHSPLAPLTSMKPADPHTQHPQQQQQQQHQRQRHHQQQQQRSRAFGVTESVEEYNTKNHVPKDREELQRALNAALQTHLPQTRRLEAFRTCTNSFMGGDMLATRYYDCLRNEFFATDNALNAVFPLLVSTVTDPDRRVALLQVEKMRNAPEVQRVCRQQEDICQRAENEKWKAQSEYAQRLTAAQQRGGTNNAKKKNTNTNGRNVWLERGGASLVAGSGQQSQSQPQSQPQSQRRERNARGAVDSASNAHTGSGRAQGTNNVSNNNNSNNRATRGGSGRGDTALVGQHSLLPTTVCYQDPEDFPALPSSNMRRAPVQQRQRNQRPNAWFNHN